EVGVPLEHREVRHPGELPRGLVDQRELASEVEAQEAEIAGDLGGVARAEQRGRAGLADRSEHLGREELRDRRAHLPVGAEADVREALRAPALRELLEL